MSLISNSNLVYEILELKLQIKIINPQFGTALHEIRTSLVI